MIGAALRTQLLANSTLSALVGAVYVGDTPYNFSYPFIRLVESGENPEDYRLGNRLIETVSIDIFTQHNPDLGVYGFGTANSIADAIRVQFDAFDGERWSDSTYSYDVWEAQYRGYAFQKNSDVGDLLKPLTLTLTYNIIS